MSSIDSAYSSSSRVTGIFSNLDTDALVEKMCAGQQSKIDKQGQKLTTCEWYTEALGEVGGAVKEFSNTYCSVLGDSSMIKAGTYYSYSVSADSDGDAVALTPSGSALAGNYSVKVIQLAENANLSSAGKVSSDGAEISANNTATLAELSFANALEFGGDNCISFEINGAAFKFSRDTALQTVINTINNNRDANVTMKYSRLTDTFTITADSGGADSRVSIKNIAGNAFGDNSAFMIREGTVENGRSSKAEINGAAVTRDSNEYTIDGMTFALKTVTEGTGEETVNFRVDRDYGATANAITDFVGALNTLLTKLGGNVSAKDYSTKYPPLTDAQKEDMSEKEIEKWEAKSKSGILHQDADIKKLVSEIKNAFFSAAGGTGQASPSIGISGGSYYGADSGLLVIDADTLTASLKTNPEMVISMFIGGGGSSATPDMGIVYKVRAALGTYQKAADESVKQTALKIGGTEDEIDKLEERLDALAESYYQKFSAMETALATLNSQSSYISQLFS